MSTDANRKWPEGVPPLPAFQAFEVRALVGGAWCEVVMKSCWSMDEVERLTWAPIIARNESGRVLASNAAARALGILPDAEQEPSDE